MQRRIVGATRRRCTQSLLAVQSLDAAHVGSMLQPATIIASSRRPSRRSLAAAWQSLHSVVPDAAMKHAPRLLCLRLICWSSAAAAQDLRRATVWDLKLGQPIRRSQPAPMEFRGFACGSNGGPPRQQLSGWSDFARCRAEAERAARGLFRIRRRARIHRARQATSSARSSRWAGTTEAGFPVVVSALFDEPGVLKAIRMVDRSAPRASRPTSLTPTCANVPTPISSAASWPRATASMRRAIARRCRRPKARARSGDCSSSRPAN